MSNWWDTSPPAESGESSGNWWDKIPPSSPKQEEPSTAEDIVKSLGSGVAQGTIGLAGLPGDVESIGRWAFGNKNPNYLPTSSDVIHKVETATGSKFYDPRTTYGKYAKTIGEFAPGLIGGPEALASKALTRVALPAIASEAAGQATEGTNFEAPARIAAAIAGHGAGQAGRSALGLGTQAATPTVQELHDAASAGYKTARNYGVEIKRRNLSNLSDSILSDLANDGFRALNVPKSWGAIEELKSPIGRHSTIDDVDSVRKALLRTGFDPSEREASRRAIAAIDNYLKTLQPSEVAINPQFAHLVGAALKEAQGNWSAMRSGKDVLDKIKNANLSASATYTGQNIDNSIRRNIKQFLDNPKLKRELSPSELEIAERIVRGTYAGNTARFLGRNLKWVLGSVLGYHAAGAKGIIGTHLAGHLLTHFGNKITEAQANRLSRIVRQDSPLARSMPPEGTLSGPASYALSGALAEESSQRNPLHVDMYPTRAKGGAVNKKEKIKRDAFLYMDSNNPHFAECSKCSLYKKGVCTILAMRVQPEWSCGAFLKGPYGGQEVKKITTPKEVGLVKHPVRCENCVYGAGNTCKLYEMLNKEMPDKFDLDTKIKPNACCNAQTPIEDKNRADGGRVNFASGGDPELSPEDQQLAATMTHQAEQPNPALPVINAVKDFYHGGLHDVFEGQGYQQPAWSDAISGFFKNPAAETALGMLGGPPTYSAVGSAVRNTKVKVATPEQWLGPRTERNYIEKNPKTGVETPRTEVKYSGIIGNSLGVKPDEIEHIGLPEWLQSKNRPGQNQAPRVTQDEINQYIESKQPQITEVRKGQTDWDAIEKLESDARRLQEKYRYNESDHDYEHYDRNMIEIQHKIDTLRNKSPEHASETLQLPGQKENYGETLLTLPTKKPSKTPFDEYQNELEQKYGERWDLSATAEEKRKFNRLFNESEDYPDTTNYKSGHWPKDPNVLLHVRHNDRVIPGEGKSLHLEEVQSDWHQTGRKNGYDIPVDPNNYEITGNGPWVIRDKKTGDFVHDFNKKDNAEGYLKDIQKGLILPWKREGLVPDAPFKTTWPDLAIKRMLHRAATEKNPDGSYKYDSLSWTPGQAQADRYNLSKYINRLVLQDNTSGGIGKPIMEGPFKEGMLEAYDHNGKKVISKYMHSPKQLEEHIGEETANKLINSNARESRSAGMGVRSKELNNQELNIGGEGMKSFYDKELVNKTNALTKKYGTRVQQKFIEGKTTYSHGVPDRYKEKQPIWHLPITPELRKAAEDSKGLYPTFAYGGAVLGYEDGGDVAPLSDSDMAQQAAESAAARVRAPYQHINEVSEKRAQMLHDELGIDEPFRSNIPVIPHVIGNKVRSIVNAPLHALTGELQVNDPETGMLTHEAVEKGQSVANLALTGGIPLARAGSLGMAGGRLRTPEGASHETITPIAEEAGLSGRGELGDGLKNVEHETIPGTEKLSSINEAVKRGVWDFNPKKTNESWGQKRHVFEIKPNDIPAHWQEHKRPITGSLEYYDPNLAMIHEEGFPILKDKEAVIPSKAEPGILYRGMSYEEYQKALKDGFFQSEGGYNIGDEQKGLTYFSTDPRQAESYAHSFAPWQYKATPSRPAVIAAIKDPGNHIINMNQPTEIGLKGTIPTSSIDHVFVGNPGIIRPGNIDIIQDYSGVKEGSRSSPSASLKWTRENNMVQ